jgi:two-component system LytT family sensor kinase
MKVKLPHYTSKDYIIMLWTIVPFSMMINAFIFGKNYFGGWSLFLSATVITGIGAGLDFILCGTVAVEMKKRLPADSQVVKRLTMMIGIFLILSGLFLYFLFSFYELIGFYGYKFNQSGFGWAYISLGVLNIFLTFLHEGVSRFERWKANLQETEQLKKTVMQCQLLGLKSQVNPHFLFNCLNSLSSLISECPEEGERFLNEMSKVYRYMLRNDADVLVTLQAELQFIHSYYALLKARYGEGIQLDININKNDLGLLLPPLTLQVILENAFSQNTMHKTAPLKISIYSDNNGCIVVRNNIQRKTVTDAFDYEAGLDNLVSRYKLLNQQRLLIRDSKAERIMQVPLIKNEMEMSV